MRWTAKQFWEERGDVVRTRFMTSNDALLIAFLAGANEAEILPMHPRVGHVTLRVSGLGWFERRRLRAELNKRGSICIEIHVEKLS